MMSLPCMIQVLEFESQYLDALPSGQMYERSFMHRDTVTHVLVSDLPPHTRSSPGRPHAFKSSSQTTSTDFFITGSVDGFVKFWKKQTVGVEFVKMYRSHLGPVDGEVLHPVTCYCYSLLLAFSQG